MTRRYIADMRPGEIIEDQVFLVASKDLRTTTQGNLYIHAVLADRTGQVPGRMWQASQELFDLMPEGGFVGLRGRAENYKGSLQFIIQAVRPVDLQTVDLGEFLPRTEKDIDQMWARVEQIVKQIRHPQLSLLMEKFLEDEPLMQAFRTAPAAVALHHSYLGGLLEHTLNVLELAVLVIPRYPELSLDLVLAGVFLHDLGKTSELSYQTNFTYSDNGHLVGHIVQSTLWIEKKCELVEAEIDGPFPERLKWLLQHLVLSHHGRYEFGSPKLPAIPEAIAIHHLDNLDAKVNMYLDQISGDADSTSDWTGYSRALETKVFKPDVMNTRSARVTV